MEQNNQLSAAIRSAALALESASLVYRDLTALWPFLTSYMPEANAPDLARLHEHMTEFHRDLNIVAWEYTELDP